MKISFSLSSQYTAVASSFTAFEPLLEALGFDSLHDQPFGTGTLRARVRAEQGDEGIVFNQVEDDWGGGPEWARAMRKKVIDAGGELINQERSREGKTTYTGTWNDRTYELQLHRSIGCKESAYFAKLRITS
jgi:hypothetical protein